MWTLLHVLLIVIGFFVAGYCGLFEVPLEAVLVAGTSFRVFWKPLTEASPSWLWWAVELKSKLVQAAVSGQTFKAAAVVALFGVVTGWIMTLGWLVVREWEFVVAREVKETVVDAIVFVPFVFLLGGALKRGRDAQEAAEDAVEIERGSEEIATDPRDPDYWDHMRQYSIAMGQIRTQIEKNIVEHCLPAFRSCFGSASSLW